MSVQSPTSQSPHTKEKAATRFLKQLLELQPGQHLQLHLEDCPIPDFHTEDTVYQVTKTSVSTTKNSEESYFHIFLGSSTVQSMADPVFKITVSRGVSENIGQTRPDAEWTKCWLNARTGKNLYGKIQWNQLHGNPVDITIVADVERCSECGQPVR
jgi:hypothetical protein